MRYCSGCVRTPGFYSGGVEEWVIDNGQLKMFLAVVHCLLRS